MTLDKQAVLERIDNDEELFSEICGIYLNDAPEIFMRLKNAVEVGEMLVATRQAHSLKSASANIGATEICELARQAEIACKEGNLQGIRHQITLIEPLLAEVLAELSKPL